jgi:integrase/recombinase XerD
MTIHRLNMGQQMSCDEVRVRIMDISLASDLYMGELARRGKRPRTRDHYQRLLWKLADRYPHADVNEITVTMLRSWVDQWQRHALSTQAQNISIVKGFFYWLHAEDYIPTDPSVALRRPKVPDSDDLDGITSVTSDEVRTMIAAAQGWTETLALALLAYTAGRRHAVAQLRRRDYNRERGELTLREKGKKAITKPVAHELRPLLDGAIDAGIYDTADAFLIPNLQPLRRKDGTRDDRIVWDSVKKVAERVGVEAHAHAIRAAFAVEFLEQNPEQLFALKELLGHRRIETTLVYLRKANRQRQMEAVLDFSWASKPPGGASSGPAGAAVAAAAAAPVTSPETGVTGPTVCVPVGRVPTSVLESLPVTEKEGFEPSFLAGQVEGPVPGKPPETGGFDLLETLGLPLEQPVARRWKVDLADATTRSALE